MSERIVECVPNFSEGRDRGVIDRITQAMASVEGVSVLDVDPGAATHRTVVTMVGCPDAVAEAAFRGIRAASELIDMRRHRGEHPRQGATDVCPFVPVRGVTMDDCVALARALGERVGKELEIPVYLYESAASRPDRKNLAHVRAGEYEGLEKKLATPEGAPDFGPKRFHAKAGATAIGARPFLIAYNVNLNTRDRRIANEVAMEIREQGRNMRDAKGRFVRGPDGEPVKRPGRLPSVKAVGWVIEEYQRAQISCNLTNPESAGLHDVFDACDEEARKIGARVTGSELVGLVPLSAMLSAGRHYLKRMGRCAGVPESRLIEAAVQSLGLAELAPFDVGQRIIEYRLRTGGALVNRSVTGFVDETSSDSPAPGGGSVAALCGSLAAALCSMVGNLTVGKRGMEDAWERCDQAAQKAQILKDAYLLDIDRDTQAFDAFLAAMRLPASTDEERRTKAQAEEAAARGAILVPFGMLERAPEVLGLAEELVAIGNPNAASDAATGAACAVACAESAYFNVLTNLRGYQGDRDFAQGTLERAKTLLLRVREVGRAVMDRFVGEGR